PRGGAWGRAVFLELAVERLARDAEDLSGGRLVAADGLEHAQDVAPLDLRQRHEIRGVVAQDEHGRAPVVPDRLRQVFHDDALVLRQRDRALDAVLQLADIARPAGGEELLRRRGRDAPYRTFGA